MAARGQTLTQAEIDALVDKAKKLHGIECEVEVDEIASVDQRSALSRGEGGTWVRAWIWVPDEE